MGWPQGKTPKGFNWCHFASMSMHHGNWGNITNYHILIRVLRTWENLQWWDSSLFKRKKEKKGRKNERKGWKNPHITLPNLVSHSQRLHKICFVSLYFSTSRSYYLVMHFEKTSIFKMLVCYESNSILILIRLMTLEIYD